MPDLETAIREALQSRSDAVVLTSTTMRSRRARVVAPLLAAAVVLVLALGTALVIAQRHGSSARPASAPSAAFVGYSWRLVSVTDSLGTQQVPASFGGSIAFAPGGAIYGNDTLNAMQATYAVTDTGYSVRDVAGTASGSVGVDSARQRIVTAVDVQFGIGSGQVDPIKVPASVSGDTLALTRGGFTVNFERAGKQTDEPSPSPTSSGPEALIGYTWIVTAINDAKGDLAVSPQEGAYLAFPDAATITGVDGRTNLSGTIQLDSKGFVVRMAPPKDLGDPPRGRVKEAVDTALGIGSLDPGFGTDVAVVFGDTVTLSAGDVTLTVTRGAEIAPSAPTSASPQVTSQGLPDTVIGYRWDLDSYTDAKGSRGVLGKKPWISFPSATTIQGSDTFNRYNGTLHLTDQGFTLSDVSGSAVGIAGNPDLERTVNAINAVFSAKGTVSFSLDGTTLTLKTGADTLVLDRGPTMVSTDSPAPTGSMSPGPSGSTSS